MRKTLMVTLAALITLPILAKESKPTPTAAGKRQGEVKTTPALLPSRSRYRNLRQQIPASAIGGATASVKAKGSQQQPHPQVRSGQRDS